MDQVIMLIKLVLLPLTMKAMFMLLAEAGVEATLIGTYATIKYNSLGIEQWVERYNGPGNGTDRAFAIAVDIKGNVYVTGESYGGSNTLGDYATVKYNSLGVEQWVKRYDGPGNGPDIARAIAVDNEGNVYVTGFSGGDGTGNDYATIKYNSSGVEQWVQRYNGSTNSRDEGTAIALDNEGNVYVTGLSMGIGSSLDYITVKYNTSGVEQWVQRYNGPANNLDAATAIAVDNEGNVYVTGESYTEIDNSDFATLKYNSSGVEQWVQRYNGPANSSDAASAIAVDNEGNVYVTGTSGGDGTGFDYATIKYNSSGDTLWVQRYNGPANNVDKARSIAIDNEGNVYVTGQSYGGSNTLDDYATVKYNSMGVEQWVQRYDGPDNSFDEVPVMAVDNGGNVYVTGMSFGIEWSYDYATIKYSQDNNNEPPINLTYELETHSLKWNNSPSANVINQLVFKQEYDPWTQTAGPWLSVADSGGLLTTDKSEWVIRTSGFYNFKIGAIFESDTLYTDSIFVNIGYRLRKIENSEVIAYNIETDAFKLINNSDNWPQAWWSQFNYSNPLLYLPVLPFNRKPDSTYVDWHLFADIIGDDQAYLSTTLNYARLFPAILWGRITGPFKGACAGFSITSLLGFYKNPEYLSQFPYMVNKEPGSIPKTDDNARKVINHLQNTQSFKYPSELVYEPADSINRTPNYLLQRLMEIFSDYENTELDQYISLYTGSGLHAVLPIAVSKNDFVPNRYDIYVYDSNHPNEYNFILIFNEENTWLFPDFLTDMSTGIALEGPLTSRLGILSIDPDYTAPENSSIKYSDKLLTSTTRTVYTSGSSSVSVLVDNETLAGYDIVNNIPVSFDNSIIEATDGILRAPKGYDVPMGETSVSFSDQIEGSAAYLMFQSLSGNYYLAERSDGAGLNETEVLELNEEGFSYLNNDNVNKTISLTSVFEDSSQSKLAKISGLGIGMNEVISLSLEEDEVNLKNIGEAKTYSIDLLYATAEEQLEFYNSSVSITTNTTHYIQPDWNHIDSSSLTILIDLGNDGTIDDTLSLVNQVTGIDNDQGSLVSPDSYNLAQNYPNPFNPSTKISWQSPVGSWQTLKVYDMLGNEVATLVDEHREAGRYEVTFDGSNLASGMYLYRLQAGSFIETRKMILIK
jgi:hypothetical protein